jgi:SSS family solute:Na+ symporter
VFFVGMLTKSRGNDFGNVLGMITGFVAVAILSGLPNELGHIVGIEFYTQPKWLPVIEFPWRVMFGTIVTFLIAVCFRTPGPETLTQAIPVDPLDELPTAPAPAPAV